MLPNPDTTVGRLYAQLSGWMPLAAFEQALAEYFDVPRPAAELADYRAKRGAVKKLRDEIVPILRHVRFTKATGEIRFDLSSDVPDCWLRDRPNAPPQGLEVTVAQSREQQRLGQQMAETKEMVPGFLGLPDNVPEPLYKKRLERGRIMRSPDGALQATVDGIKACLRKKNRPKFARHDLLIEAPLFGLSTERLGILENDLRSAASTLPFREIHIIGATDASPFGFRVT
jgi:hypothetical protein